MNTNVKQFGIAYRLFYIVLKKLYETSVGVKLSQSSKRIVIRCSGQGQEPQIEMDKQLLEFSPILPHSSGDEKEIVVKNPCNFPIEIYSLEFDKVYLEEEKVCDSYVTSRCCTFAPKPLAIAFAYFL